MVMLGRKRFSVHLPLLTSYSIISREACTQAKNSPQQSEACRPGNISTGQHTKAAPSPLLRQIMSLPCLPPLLRTPRKPAASGPGEDGLSRWLAHAPSLMAWAATPCLQACMGTSDAEDLLQRFLLPAQRDSHHSGVMKAYRLPAPESESGHASLPAGATVVW